MSRTMMLNRLTIALGITLLSIASIALVVQLIPSGDKGAIDNTDSIITSDFNLKESPVEHVRRQRITDYFQKSVLMLHAKQYDYAITVLHELLLLAPEMPEVPTNMGYALLGAKRYSAARDFFLSAIELNSEQLNAYYGLALSESELNNQVGALGAMQTFIHLSPSDDAHLDKARQLMGEWTVRFKEQRPVTPDQVQSTPLEVIAGQ
ncbi:MAG: hypothetical protein V7699_00645 [Porticoccus sp.]